MEKITELIDWKIDYKTRQQIKSWEIVLDHIIHALYVKEPLTQYQCQFIAERLETISHEMMAINM